LAAPVVLLAFGYKGCGAHGPNEHVYLDMYQRGIHTMIYFCEALAEM
jgi:acetylornithine deacetylase/succinyl-diaminopimelate desuccinylase-like protein